MKLTRETTQVRLASESMKDKLLAVKAKIKHCGDYGSLFWNEKEKKVHWTAGDADGGDESTPMDEIEEMFLAVAGVKEVEIGDESSPDHDDPDWESLE